MAPELEQIASSGRYGFPRRIFCHEVPFKCSDVSRENDLEILKFCIAKAAEKYPGRLPDFGPAFV
jgi:hypothetical protein